MDKGRNYYAAMLSATAMAVFTKLAYSGLAPTAPHKLENAVNEKASKNT